MKPGDIITIAGVQVEVIEATIEPARFVMSDASDGRPRETRCQFATVRDIRKPIAPGARDRR